jgi:nucleoside-diphosphate kinase
LERTLVLIKPDAVQRGLSFAILGRLEARGLKLVGLKFLQVPRDLAARHYAVHQGKPFYDKLIAYICSSPVVAAVFEGTRVIDVVRSTVGTTNAADAASGTIRGDLALEIGRNLVHASDGPETAQQELGLWFQPQELVGWGRDLDRWVFE